MMITIVCNDAGFEGQYASDASISSSLAGKGTYANCWTMLHAPVQMLALSEGVHSVCGACIGLHAWERWRQAVELMHARGYWSFWGPEVG